MSAPRGIVRPDSDFPFTDERHGLVCTNCKKDVDVDFCTSDDASEILLSACCVTPVRPSRPDKRGRKAIAARWGDDTAACGFTATPNVLLAHLAALGLSPLDVVLLDLIELHRRESEQAWPGEALLAELAGVSVSQVGRRLRQMRTAGLIEWTRERGYGGQWSYRIYTRHGLTAVCGLLAANRRAQPDDDLPAEERRARERAGLPELLSKLAKAHRASVQCGGTTAHEGAVDHSASVRGGEQKSAPPPRISAVDHRAPVQSTTAHQCATKQRQVEQEAKEPDSPKGASSRASRIDGAHEQLADPFALPDEPEAW